MRDYYEVLGVARDASDKAIKDAFRTLVMSYQEPWAGERFRGFAEVDHAVSP